MTGIFSTFYGVCGAIGYQSGMVLPFLSIEQGIPLIPWTVLIYIILYPTYLIASMHSYRDEEQMNKLLYAFCLLTLISCAIFLFFPINYPRYLYPLPLDNQPLTLLLRAVRFIDKPSNCLPSLHVSLCFTFAFAFWHQSKKQFWLAILISTLIAISTLTTKQHYVYDVISGFMLSLSLWFGFDRFTRISDN